MKDKKIITRRYFIKSTAAVTIGTPLFLTAAKSVYSESEKKTPVILVRNKEVFDTKGAPKEKIVIKMLDSAVMALTEAQNPVEAWKAIIKPDDIVGIKSNVWSYIPTTTQVEQALKKRVMDVGVAEENIGIDDRGVLRNSVFKRATAFINVRPMRSHHWSGVGSLIKNYIMFAPNPSKYHPDSCADLASLWELPIVKGKTRLNILVMLTPQFHSVGPHSFSPKFVWQYYGFLVGFDPVACDATGIRIIQAKRKEYFKDDRLLNPPPKHVFLADTRYHLGTADFEKINLIKIGYDKDSFI